MRILMKSTDDMRPFTPLPCLTIIEVPRHKDLGLHTQCWPNLLSSMRIAMQVILAQPRGCCAGVVRAIEIVELALKKYGRPVYVRHEIVHNRHLVESLRTKRAQFVESWSEVPRGAVTIFSAHGVSRAVEEEAADRRLAVLDATCPLVAKVHSQGQRYVDQGRTVILIGHAGHPEVEGTM